MNAVHRMCGDNQPVSAQSLIKRGGLDINAGNTYDRTSLYMAALEGRVEVVRALLAHEAQQ